MRRVFRKFFRIACYVCGVAFLVGGVAWLVCPKPALQDYQTWSRVWYDSTGKLLRIDLAEDERYRSYLALDEIASELIEATVLYEDQDYYSHSGVDFPAIFRAFWQTYITQERRIGASTITMQVARLRWGIESHKTLGKITQILRAIQLARHYSKDDILEAYLNLAPYGRNIEGVGAASLIYFNKPASALSLPEALTLSVIPQNPNQRDPSRANGYAKLLLAREHLFQRWQERYPEAKNKNAQMAMPLAVRTLEQLPFYAPHFLDYLNSQLPAWESGEFHTSLDLEKQRSLEEQAKAYAQQYSEKGIDNVALLLLNYKTMDVEAMVGSANFSKNEIQGQVNGTTAKRSPGSTLKPFVYALAMDEGLIHPMSMMKDSPQRFAGFTPENFDEKFLGPLLVKDALALSRNVPAVELQAALREKSFYQWLQSAGISGLKDEGHYGLALTLGGAEVTMLELVKLYASLANGGVLQEPAFYVNPAAETSSVKDSGKRVLSPEASFMVLDILDSITPPEEYSRPTNKRHNAMAWKTGTSWAFRDAWSIGISGPYVLGVWVGNFNGEGNPEFIGRKAAGPLLFKAMDSVLPNGDWTLKDSLNPNELNLAKIDMCSFTGDLPGRYCPRREESWFIPGVSPIKVSDVYRKIAIDKQSGLRACNLDKEGLEFKIFEFWPSDLQLIFRDAGITLEQIPAYMPECLLEERDSGGLIPKISSPQSTIEYILTAANNASSPDEIEFSAVVDSDVEYLYWFVEKEFVGSSKAGESLFWEAHTGEFGVSVVDDSGRSASTRIKVVEYH